MKKILFALIIVFLGACSGRSYYQAYKSFADNIIIDGTPLSFENDDFIVTYHLSDNINEVGFTLFNKTNSELTVLTDQSYFVLNGQSFSYTPGNSSLNIERGKPTIPYNPYINGQVKMVVVPANRGVNISNFKVTQGSKKSTNLDKYITQKDVRVVPRGNGKGNFDLYSVIIYMLTDKATGQNTNKFYVNEITNAPKMGMEPGDKRPFLPVYVKLNSPIEVYKNINPTLIYLWGGQ